MENLISFSHNTFIKFEEYLYRRVAAVRKTSIEPNICAIIGAVIFLERCPRIPSNLGLRLHINNDYFHHMCIIRLQHSTYQDLKAQPSTAINHSPPIRTNDLRHDFEYISELWNA
jgi:hypothetical protein